MKYLLILLFLILASILSVIAQVPPRISQGGMGNMPKNGVVKGKIIDADSKAPMEYANIAIFSKRDSSLVSGGVTNAEGTFEIKELPFGAFYVVANFIGFEKTTVKDIRIIPNAPTVNLGTIELAVESKTLGTVEVTAERSRIEYKIDKKVINVSQDINAAGGTAVTALENTPSIEVDIDGNVLLRGSSSFTVLIDGRPSVLTGSDALKQIPSSVIDNIEIITNPSVKYDPDGMAGIINVVMKKNILAGFNGLINVNAGTGNDFNAINKYGTDLTMNYKTKKYNLLFGANWNENTDVGRMKARRESYNRDTITFLNSDGKRNQTRKGKQIRAGFDYFISDKTSVTLLGEVGEFGFEADQGSKIKKYQNFYRDSLDIDTFMISKDISSRDGSYESANANFLTKFDDSGMHKLEGAFEYRHRKGNAPRTVEEDLSEETYQQTFDTLSSITTTEDDDSEDIRIKLDYTRPLNKGGKFEAGLQSRMESEKEIFNFKELDILSGNFFDNPDFTSDMIFNEDIHSIYSTLSGKLNKIQYMLGLRGEYTYRTIDHSKSDTISKTKLNRFDPFPSAHFSYEINENNQLMASYSRRINRPDGRDLDPFPNYINRYTIRKGNPALKPEYTDSYELGFMRKFGSSYLSLETFYRTTNDLMSRKEWKDTIQNINFMTMENFDKDHSIGGELMGNINFNKWLLVNATVTLYDYQMKNDSVDKSSTNYSARLNTTIKFSPNSRLQLMGNYRSSSISAQGEQLDMFFTNISYRQEFMKKKLSATLSLRDIFGTGKFGGNNVGPNFISNFRMQREPRVLTLTLSYKINNYKMDRESPQEQPSQGGGGEDMF